MKGEREKERKRDTSIFTFLRRAALCLNRPPFVVSSSSLDVGGVITFQKLPRFAEFHPLHERTHASVSLPSVDNSLLACFERPAVKQLC